jgi:hypothetical protein
MRSNYYGNVASSRLGTRSPSAPEAAAPPDGASLSAALSSPAYSPSDHGPQERRGPVAPGHDPQGGPPCSHGPDAELMRGGGTACGNHVAALPRSPEPQVVQLPREASGWAGCPLRDLDRLNSHELRLQPGLAVLQKHAHNLLKVALQLIQGRTLTVRTGPPWYVSNEEAGIGIALDDEAIATHFRYSP